MSDPVIDPAIDPVVVDDHVDEDEFDHAAYDNSFGNRAKQGWIVFQATMMTVYMIIGVCAYRKLITKMWHRRNTLFLFQTVCIMCLVVNEFTHRHIAALFVILLFTQYSLFITFNIVIDSCITDAQDKSWRENKLQAFNKVFRIFMHVATAGLFLSTFWMKDCHDSIYPFNFVAIVIIILAHQVYDIFLACNGYMIDWDNLPYMSQNKLQYNKELFQKQTKALLIGNLVFGVISILTVASGYFIINRQKEEGATQHLLCVHGTEWIYMSPIGNIFGTLHQLLILMQINITQYVLVKCPRNAGLFNVEKVDLMHTMGTGLRSKLLQQSESDPSLATSNSAVAINGGEKTLTLGQILQRIKESQMEKDDNFRA